MSRHNRAVPALPSVAECMEAWRKIKRRVEAGESIPLHIRSLAEEALNERFVVRGKGQRPDVHDRRAGDDSFDSVVAL